MKRFNPRMIRRPAKKTVMFKWCSKCGTRNEYDLNFCKVCGTYLNMEFKVHPEKSKN